MSLTNKIKENLTYIYEQTGLRLDLCDHFTGIHYMCNEPYFNVVLKDKLSESVDYDNFKRWCDKYGVKIENNGLKRLSIFI